MPAARTETERRGAEVVADAPHAPAPPKADGAYTVVARRYRPQRFEDVVGQDHVVEALRNAIRSNRVTHAYLFSGTRGVGKTSIARIFAKCLNCTHGPTDAPDLTCEICRDIAAGQDVDVIEIDGASNNGVESVRELRQNAGLRPSRARFKIYYIDEVHMLSPGAFNALLKTLEEPPPHVKFFFATTEPNKILPTVLSRCQRYDFNAISVDLLIKTLGKICTGEGIEADEEALRVVARRAGGSMRDGESLLDQLLSNGSRRLTAEGVHRALGTAPDDRVLALLESLAGRDVAGALAAVDRSVGQGVQPADLLTGALDFLRDAMIAASGADVAPLAASPSQAPQLAAIARSMGLDSILAALEILSQAKLRLRGSPHGRTIVEVALARVARLEDFAEIGALIDRLSSIQDGTGPPPAKKKLNAADPPPDRPPPPTPSPVAISAPTPGLTTPGPPRAIKSPAPAPIVEAPPAQAVESAATTDLDGLVMLWPRLVAMLGDPLRSHLGRVKPTAWDGAGPVVIAIPPGYNFVADACEEPDALGRIESTLRSLTGRPLSLRFDRGEMPRPEPATARPSAAAHEGLDADPMVRRVVELFEARKIKVEAEETGGAA